MIGYGTFLDFTHQCILFRRNAALSLKMSQELNPTLFRFNLRARNIPSTDKQEDIMEQVNLGSVIENAITRFSQNRVGDKPPVFVTLAPALPQIPWKGSALRQFLQFFLYESLLTSD